MGVTMEYIARMANVSKATVSRVVNGKTEGVGKETRERIQRIIEEYGYTPNLVARGMATSRSKTIGLVIPNITNPFFPDLIRSLQIPLQAYGYTVMLCDTDSSRQAEENILKTLQAKRVDGIILATVQEEGHHSQENVRLDVPCILIDRKSKVIDYDVGVFMDNEFAFWSATNLILRHGNRRIAFIKGPDDLSTTKERLLGFQSAMKQYGVPIDPDLILNGDFGFRSGYTAVMMLHRRRIPFTAIVASNDMMALGAIQALRELNISVPEEVEVIGCDDIPFSSLIQPTLTTMRIPLEKFGRQVASIMMDLIAGNPVSEKNIRLEAELILRGSTRGTKQETKGT